jgi:Fic family protein
MDQTDESLAKTLARAKFWETYRDMELNARQQKILSMLLDDFFGKLQVSKYAVNAKTSPDTALRGLQNLVKKGYRKNKAVVGGTSYKIKGR